MLIWSNINHRGTCGVCYVLVDGEIWFVDIEDGPEYTKSLLPDPKDWIDEFEEPFASLLEWLTA